MTGVVISYVHPGWVQHTFMQSLLVLMGHDHRSEAPAVSGVMPVRFLPAGIAHTRNEAVRTFLAGDGEWLWFVDTDMGFRPDTLQSLLASADPETRPVVGALCYGVLEEEPDGLGGFVTRVLPTLRGWADDAQAFTEWDGPVPSGLVRVAGTGAACLLVHRSVFNTIPDAWFSPIIDGTGALVGEDLSFCWRLMAADIPVYVDTRVPTTHQKHFWANGGSDGTAR